MRAISQIAGYGGKENSGYERESGFQELQAYTRTKTVWMNMSDDPIANPFKPR